MFQEKWNFVLGEIAECSRRSGTLSGERFPRQFKRERGSPLVHTSRYYIVKRRAGTVFTTMTGRVGRVDNLSMQCRRDLFVGGNFLCSRLGSERSHSFD